MVPDCIENTNFKYLVIDGKYVSSLVVTCMPQSASFLEIIDSIDRSFIYDMSIYINKLDSNKFLNDITYNLASTNSEMNITNSNRKDLDILSKSKEELKGIRKRIQIEGEEVYTISISFTFYSYFLDELFKNINYFKSKLNSKSIYSKIQNFNQLQTYLSNLPLKFDHSSNNKPHLTTSSLINIFPFYISNIMDNNGVLFGNAYQKNMMCIIDLFSNKYTNSNMCILGSSGSGKTYFTKLMIIRHYLFNVKQFIVDYEGEYKEFILSLGGIYIFSESYINILEITKYDIRKYDENFLHLKIKYVVNFLTNVLELEENQSTSLYKGIENTYKEFDINYNTIVEINNNSEQNRYCNNYQFPTLADVLKNIDSKEIKSKLKIAINGHLRYLTGKRNPDLDNSIICIFSREIINSKSYIVLEYLFKYIEDFMMEYEKKSLIYIDELWKYIKNYELSKYIFEFYKTIRKRNAGIIGITQDISDFAIGDKEELANSILSNSAFKVFFKTEYRDIKVISNIVNFNTDGIFKLSKGQAILNIMNDYIKLDIIANNHEKELIENENNNSIRK